MEKYYYSCDGGSLAIGNETFFCHYPNKYGDGTHVVYIKQKGESLPLDTTYYNLYFVGSVEGDFNLYNYDCLSKKDRTDPEFIIKNLQGRYGIYAFKDAFSGDILIEQWD